MGRLKPHTISAAELQGAGWPGLAEPNSRSLRAVRADLDVKLALTRGRQRSRQDSIDPKPARGDNRLCKMRMPSRISRPRYSSGVLNASTFR